MKQKPTRIEINTLDFLLILLFDSDIREVVYGRDEQRKYGVGSYHRYLSKTRSNYHFGSSSSLQSHKNAPDSWFGTRRQPCPRD